MAKITGTKSPKNKSNVSKTVAGLAPPPPVAVAAAASPAAAPKSAPKSKKDAKKIPSPQPVEMDDLPDSPSVSNSSSEDEAEIEANGAAVVWPKADDLELFKRIRGTCPKDDTMKYDSRVNHVTWETIKFGAYSADDCKSRWVTVQSHLRHYRLLAEVLDDAVKWVDTPWYNFNKGGKKQSNLKHPDQPKKPLTSYMLFYMEQKDTVAKQNPGLSMTELSKVIATLYNGLSDKKKKKYVKMAEAKKEEYDKEMAKFMEEHPDYVVPKSAKFSAMPSKSSAPKVPTPLKLYSDANMEKFIKEGMTPTEARHHCAKTYKELSDKQKMKWINQALIAEVQYNEELAKFKAKYPDVELGKKTSLLTKEEVQIKDKHEGKPEKPPNSGYSLFSKTLLSSDSLKKFESKERMTEISRMWKELSDEDKQEYNVQAAALNHQYKMQYASYLEKLTPEQRLVELATTGVKGQKRVAAKDKTEEMASPKKRKTDDGVEGDSGEEDDDDFESAPKKPVIQKPNSSLQMFCSSSENKYRAKHPKLSQQELMRLMAKDFAKLSAEKKKLYDTMAQKSKSEVVKTPPKAAKAKSPPVAVAAPVPKPAPAAPAPSKKATAKPKADAAPSKAAAKKLGDASNGSPVAQLAKSKASANSKAPAPAAKAGKPVQPNQPPSWAEKYSLFKGEPAKPLGNVQDYYAGVNGLDRASGEFQWAKLSDKQRKKFGEEHKKKLAQYATEFENFVRLLPTDELKKFRALMKTRPSLSPSKQSAADDDDSSDHYEDAKSSESESEDEPQQRQQQDETSEDEDDSDDDDDDE